MKKFFLANKVLIGLSEVRDGDMQDFRKNDAKIVAQIRENQARFFAKINLKFENVARVRVDYNSENFCRFHEVFVQNSGGGILPEKPIFAADALATREKNLGLFLPLADCLGAVIYDAKNEILMISHLGRHATEQFGAQKSVEFLAKKFGTAPRDLQIWLSPAAGKENYPLYKFDGKSLREENISQFLDAGILRENILSEEIDTTTSREYFSHSEFLRGRRKIDGRFAIVAKIV
jgi:copper oxidase (laccase) domain-containing protein